MMASTMAGRIALWGGRLLRGRRAACTALLLGLAGCQSSGPVDNPIGQSLTWFSYLDAQDLEAACGPGSPDRLRFVYNGTWEDQVRTYDIRRTAGGAEVDARVLGQGNIASVLVQGFNLFGPWQAQKSTTQQSEGWLRDLVGALYASGFQAQPPQGRWLRSDAYFWVAAACLDGRYHWNAWASDWPRRAPEFIAQVRFVDPLLQADRTGVPYNPPQRQELSNWASGADGRRSGFRLEIAGDGLALGPQF